MAAVSPTEPPTVPIRPAGGEHFDPLAFLNRINGLLMALAVSAWLLIGSDYRERVVGLEKAQVDVVQVLGALKVSVESLKVETGLRAEAAREERDRAQGKDAELDARLRQVEQQAVRSEPPRR